MQQHVILKFVSEVSGTVRLAEVPANASVEAIRWTFKEKFGEEAGGLSYQLPGDEDFISIVDERDLELALRLRSSRTLDIFVSAPSAAPTAAARSFLNPGFSQPDCFTEASQRLGRFAIDASPDQLKVLLEALDLKPRRLVRVGLALPKSLKAAAAAAAAAAPAAPSSSSSSSSKAGPTSGPAQKDVPRSFDSTFLDDDEDEEGEVVVTAPSLDQEDEDQWSQIGALKIVDDAPKPKRTACPDDEALPVAPPVGSGEDPVVASLRARGVTLDAETIYICLHVLRVFPRRFVKMGLVAEADKAHVCFKTGCGAAAHVRFLRAVDAGLGHWSHGLGRGGRGFGRGRGRSHWAGAKAGYHHKGKGHHGHHHGDGFGHGRGGRGHDFKGKGMPGPEAPHPFHAAEHHPPSPFGPPPPFHHHQPGPPPPFHHHQPGSPPPFHHHHRSATRDAQFHETTRHGHHAPPHHNIHGDY